MIKLMFLFNISYQIFIAANRTLSLFRWCICRKRHSHSGNRCNFDMQLWCWVLRQAFCMLGSRRHPKQWLRQWGDQVRRDISDQQIVRTLPVEGQSCWGWCVSHHQAGWGEWLWEVWLSRGNSWLVQWSQTWDISDCSGRWEPQGWMGLWAGWKSALVLYDRRF